MDNRVPVPSQDDPRDRNLNAVLAWCFWWRGLASTFAQRTAMTPIDIVEAQLMMNAVLHSPPLRSPSPELKR